MPRLESLEPATGDARACATKARMGKSRLALQRIAAGLGAALAASWPALAPAQVKIGLALLLTGPAASPGIPARDTATLLPRQIGGQSVEYIVLDDASDT